MYEQLDADRQREHPEWGTWPAPPFEAVEPATWLQVRPDRDAPPS
jgi:hypothetical protein